MLEYKRGFILILSPHLKEILIFKKPQTLTYIPILMIACSALCAMSAAILTPALPLIEQFFSSKTDASLKILSFNLLGISLSGLLYGALSESLGRRLLFLVGLSLFSVCTFLSFFADSLTMLFVLQIMQGCGIGSASVLPLAVIRDVYSGKKAAALLSIFGTLMGFSPALSPFIGGIITEYLGWKYIFLTLSFIGVSLVFGIFLALPETHPKQLRHPISGKRLFKNYGRMFLNIRFLRFAALPWFSFGGLWIYASSAPFFFIEKLGLTSAQYGMYPMITVFGIVAGNFFMNRFIKFWELSKFLKIGAVAMVFGISNVLILAEYKCVSPLLYALSMFLYAFGHGCIWSPSLNLAMDAVLHGKGYGAALIRSGQVFSASMGVVLSGILYQGNLILPGVVILGCAGLVNLFVWTSPKEDHDFSIKEFS